MCLNTQHFNWTKGFSNPWLLYLPVLPVSQSGLPQAFVCTVPEWKIMALLVVYFQYLVSKL